MRGHPALLGVALLLLLLSLLLLPVLGQQTTGVIRTSDYGDALTTGNQYCWRGYSFLLSRETVVTHLVGGGSGTSTASNFVGAIMSASFDADSGTVIPQSLLGSVNFPGTTPNQEVALSSPLTLQPGQWYFLGQGRSGSNGKIHHFVNSMNVPDLVLASLRIEQWMPAEGAWTWATGAGNRCTGSPESAIGGREPFTTPVNVAMGFRYLTDGVVLPQVETLVGSPLQGRLLHLGGGPTSLYMEYGTGSDGSSITTGLVLVLAEPNYDGTVPYPFGAPIFGLPPSTLFYYRARVINDAGRVDGDILSFTTPPKPGPPTLTATLGRDGALLVTATVAPEVTNLQYSLDGGSSWITRVPAGAAFPLLITGLTNGVTYPIRLRAIREGVLSDPSSSMNGTPTPLVVVTPTAGSSFQFNEEVTVTWSWSDTVTLEVLESGDLVTTIATAYTGSSFQWFPLGLSLAPSSAYSIRLVSANPSSPSLSGSFSIVAAILSLSRSNPSVVVFNGYTDTLEASVSNADYISNSVAEYEVQVYRGVDFVRSISLDLPAAGFSWKNPSSPTDVPDTQYSLRLVSSAYGNIFVPAQTAAFQIATVSVAVTVPSTVYLGVSFPVATDSSGTGADPPFSHMQFDFVEAGSTSTVALDLEVHPRDDSFNVVLLADGSTTVGQSYAVRAADPNHQAIEFFSNDIVVEAPALSVSVNEAILYNRWSTSTIEWDFSPVVSISLNLAVQLRRGSGEIIQTLFSGKDSSSGMEAWDLSGASFPPGADYYLHAVDTVLGVSADSAQRFSILNVDISVSMLNASVFAGYAGGSLILSWSTSPATSNLEPYVLEVFHGAGNASTLVEELADDLTSAGTDQFTISSTLTPSNEYYVRITSSVDPAVTAVCGPFSTLVGSIDISDPAVGTVWFQGYPQTVTWQAQSPPISAVSASLLYPDQQVAATLFSNEIVLGSGVPVSTVVTIPPGGVVPGDNFLVRVADAVTSGVSGSLSISQIIMTVESPSVVFIGYTSLSWTTVSSSGHPVPTASVRFELWATSVGFLSTLSTSLPTSGSLTLTTSALPLVGVELGAENMYSARIVDEAYGAVNSLLSPSFVIQRVNITVERPFAGELVFNGYQGPDIVWSVFPTSGSPLGALTVSLLQFPSLVVLDVLSVDVPSNTSSIPWSLNSSEFTSTAESGGLYVVQVSDGITTAVSAPFSIANFTATLSLVRHPSTVFRWLNASAELSVSLPPDFVTHPPAEASLVDVLLCVDRDLGEVDSSALSAHCPWVLASEVPLPVGGNLTAVHLSFGGAVGSEAPHRGASADFSLVLTRTGTPTFVGQSAVLISLQDAVSDVRVSNLQYGSIFVGYSGWTVSWALHPDVLLVAGQDVLVMVQLWRDQPDTPTNVVLGAALLQDQQMSWDVVQPEDFAGTGEGFFFVMCTAFSGECLASGSDQHKFPVHDAVVTVSLPDAGTRVFRGYPSNLAWTTNADFPSEVTFDVLWFRHGLSDVVTVATSLSASEAFGFSWIPSIAGDNDMQLQVRPVGFLAPSAGNSSIFSVQAVTFLIPSPALGQITFRGYAGPEVAWSVVPVDAPVAIASVSLNLVHAADISVQILQLGSGQNSSGLLSWGQVDPLVTPGKDFHIRVSDGISTGLSAAFEITDLNVTVGLASNPAGTVFRWYSAWVEILSATAVLPAEISHVDMLLCAGLDPLAGVSLDPVALAAVLQLHCSWTLGSSVALPTSQPLSVSFAGNVGMEAPAVEEPYFSIVLVEEGGGWILAGGPSAAFRLHDVLGNIRVVGLGGSSQVFNEYAGWTVLFDPHPSAQQLLGPALEVSFPLLRWSESSSSAPLPVQFHRISDPLNQEEEVLGPVLLSSGMVHWDLSDKHVGSGSGFVFGAFDPDLGSQLLSIGHNFTVNDARVLVTSPVSSSVLYPGYPFLVSWELVDIPDANVTVSLVHVPSEVVTSVSSLESNGQFLWTPDVHLSGGLYRIEVQPIGFFSGTVGKSDEFSVEAIQVNVPAPSLGQVVFNNFSSILLSWSVAPSAAPTQSVRIELLRQSQPGTVVSVLATNQSTSGSLTWSLLGVRISPGSNYFVRVTDGIVVGASALFQISDLSVGASLGPNNPYQVAYRWFDATVIFTGALDILPDTLTSLDVLLCVHRAPGTKDAASLQSLCPWVLASGVAIPESRNVSVSFGGAVGEGAPSGAGPVFSLVLVQGGTVLFVGESSESIEVVDAVSNVRTIGYGGVSGGTVFSGYGGWQIEWDVHAHAAEVLGEVQVVLSLSADTSVFTSVSTTDLSGAPLAPVYLGPVSLLYASPLHWNLTGLRTSVLGAGNAFWMHRTSSNIPMNNSTLAVGGPFSIAELSVEVLSPSAGSRIFAEYPFLLRWSLSGGFPPEESTVQVSVLGLGAPIVLESSVAGQELLWTPSGDIFAAAAAGDDELVLEVQPTGMFAKTVGLSDVFLVNRVSVVVSAPQAGEVVFNNFTGPVLQWLFSPMDAPFGPIFVHLVTVVSDAEGPASPTITMIDTLVTGDGSYNGTHHWSLYGKQYTPGTSYAIQVTDGATTGLSSNFQISDLAIGVTLSHNEAQVAFRWFEAVVDITVAQGALPPDITSVDMLLCAYRSGNETSVSWLQARCPWQLASAIPVLQQENVTVSFGGVIGQEADHTTHPAFTIVLVRAATLLFVGQSPSFRILDAVSGLSVSGLGELAEVYSGYGGWSLSWQVHPHLSNVVASEGGIPVSLVMRDNQGAAVQYQLRSDSSISGAEVLGPVDLFAETVSWNLTDRRVGVGSGFSFELVQDWSGEVIASGGNISVFDPEIVVDLPDGTPNTIFKRYPTNVAWRAVEGGQLAQQAFRIRLLRTAHGSGPAETVLVEAITGSQWEWIPDEDVEASSEMEYQIEVSGADFFTQTIGRSPVFTVEELSVQLSGPAAGDVVFPGYPIILSWALSHSESLVESLLLSSAQASMGGGGIPQWEILVTSLEGSSTSLPIPSSVICCSWSADIAGNFLPGSQVMVTLRDANQWLTASSQSGVSIDIGILQLLVNTPLPGQVFWNMYGHLTVAWTVQPPVSPLGPINVTLLRADSIVTSLAVEVSGASGSLQRPLVEQQDCFPAASDYSVVVSDGVTLNHTEFFSILDPALISVPVPEAGTVLFRYYDSLSAVATFRGPGGVDSLQADLLLDDIVVVSNIGSMETTVEPLLGSSAEQTVSLSPAWLIPPTLSRGSTYVVRVVDVNRPDDIFATSAPFVLEDTFASVSVLGVAYAGFALDVSVSCRGNPSITAAEIVLLHEDAVLGSSVEIPNFVCDPLNDEILSWTISEGVVPGSGFVFRVRDPLPSLVDSVFVDSSSFSIYAPVIQVVSPAPGILLFGGFSYPVEWLCSYLGTSQVAVEWARVPESQWQPIALVSSTQCSPSLPVATSQNSATFVAPLPADLGIDSSQELLVKIRVQDALHGGIIGLSETLPVVDTLFDVQLSPSVTVMNSEAEIQFSFRCNPNPLSANSTLTVLGRRIGHQDIVVMSSSSSWACPQLGSVSSGIWVMDSSVPSGEYHLVVQLDDHPFTASQSTESLTVLEGEIRVSVDTEVVSWSPAEAIFRGFRHDIHWSCNSVLTTAVDIFLFSVSENSHVPIATQVPATCEMGPLNSGGSLVNTFAWTVSLPSGFALDQDMRVVVRDSSTPVIVDQSGVFRVQDGKIDIVEPRTGHLWLKYEMQQIVFQCNNPGMSVVDVTVHYQLVNVGSAVHSFVVAAGMRVDCREGVNNTAEWIPPRDMIAGEASYSISIESSQSSAVLASVSIVDVDDPVIEISQPVEGDEISLGGFVQIRWRCNRERSSQFLVVVAPPNFLFTGPYHFSALTPTLCVRRVLGGTDSSDRQRVVGRKSTVSGPRWDTGPRASSADLVNTLSWVLPLNFSGPTSAQVRVTDISHPSRQITDISGVFQLASVPGSSTSQANSNSGQNSNLLPLLAIGALPLAAVVTWFSWWCCCKAACCGCLRRRHRRNLKGGTRYYDPFWGDVQTVALAGIPESGREVAAHRDESGYQSVSKGSLVVPPLYFGVPPSHAGDHARFWPMSCLLVDTLTKGTMKPKPPRRRVVSTPRAPSTPEAPPLPLLPRAWGSHPLDDGIMVSPSTMQHLQFVLFPRGSITVGRSCSPPQPPPFVLRTASRNHPLMPPTQVHRFPPPPPPRPVAAALPLSGASSSDVDPGMSALASVIATMRKRLTGNTCRPKHTPFARSNLLLDPSCNNTSANDSKGPSECPSEWSMGNDGDEDSRQSSGGGNNNIFRSNGDSGRQSAIREHLVSLFQRRMANQYPVNATQCHHPPLPEIPTEREYQAPEAEIPMAQSLAFSPRPPAPPSHGHAMSQSRLRRRQEAKKSLTSLQERASSLLFLRRLKLAARRDDPAHAPVSQGPRGGDAAQALSPFGRRFRQDPV